MKELQKLIKNKELIVRKKVASFLEKIFLFFDYDFCHDDYKKIVYNESPCKTKLEKKMKSYYDGMLYLFNNSVNELTDDILYKFLVLVNYKDNNPLLRLKLISKYAFEKNNIFLDKAIEYHLFIYKLLNCDEVDKTIISLIFLNYILIKEKIPTIKLLYKDLEEYMNMRSKYFNGDVKSIYKFLLAVLKKSKNQDKSYYKKLIPLELEDVKKVLYDDREIIKKKYCIDHLIIFGSFSKRTQRIDSDIDLMCIFNDYVSYTKKLELVEKFKEDYLLVFNRYVDMLEITNYLTNTIISEMDKYEKIF